MNEGRERIPLIMASLIVHLRIVIDRSHPPPTPLVGMKSNSVVVSVETYFPAEKNERLCGKLLGKEATPH